MIDEERPEPESEDTGDDGEDSKRGKDDRSFGVGETIEFDI